MEEKEIHMPRRLSPRTRARLRRGFRDSSIVTQAAKRQLGEQGIRQTSTVEVGHTHDGQILIEVRSEDRRDRERLTSIWLLPDDAARLAGLLFREVPRADERERENAKRESEQLRKK